MSLNSNNLTVVMFLIPLAEIHSLQNTNYPRITLYNIVEDLKFTRFVRFLIVDYIRMI